MIPTWKIEPTLKCNLKAGTNLKDGTNFELDTSFEAGTDLKLVPTWIIYKEMFTMYTQPVIDNVDSVVLIVVV